MTHDVSYSRFIGLLGKKSNASSTRKKKRGAPSLEKHEVRVYLALYKMTNGNKSLIQQIILARYNPTDLVSTY